MDNTGILMDINGSCKRLHDYGSNHHLSMFFFFFLMVIFSSYVRLPEGNPYAPGMVYLPDTLGDFVAYMEHMGNAKCKKSVVLW